MGLVLSWVGWSAVNLGLEEAEGNRGSQIGKVTEMLADAPWIAWEKYMEHLVEGGWKLEKWRYCWWSMG